MGKFNITKPFRKKPYRDANLDNADFLGPQYFEVCCPENEPTPYDPSVWVEIGRGTIHSINGIVQGGKRRYKFFVRKDSQKPS